MYEPKPILKFTDKNSSEKNQYVEINLDEFTWPKGGKGTCPYCGGKLTGVGKDWVCENEECGAEFFGPIF